LEIAWLATFARDQAGGAGVDVTLDEPVNLAPGKIQSSGRCAGFDLASDDGLDRFESIQLLHGHGDGLGFGHTELQTAIGGFSMIGMAAQPFDPSETF
jgi:hypothetical protein